MRRELAGDTNGRGHTALLGVIALTVAAIGAPSLADAQMDSGDRQASSFTFDQERPDRPSALRLKIDYVNPDDPDAKPFAVQTVVEELTRGARIDTSVPERCSASNVQLMAQGEAACPPGSRVGGGQVDLDTGIPGPSRIVENDVTQFNNEDELILLFEPEGGAGARAVSRAPIDGGRKITAESPPIPGGPPDGFAAIKRVRLTLERISVGDGDARRSYVTTPGTCPADEAWKNTIGFTYRDGVTQTERSPSPCEPSARRTCRDRHATIEGTGRGDLIRGTPDRDVIAAGGGSDTVGGRGGRDRICAGRGADEVRGASSRDWIYGDGGDDLLRGGKGHDSLHGGRGDDVLRGGPGSDNCGGGRGQDELTSCAG